jgi:hypothetical protein
VTLARSRGRDGLDFPGLEESMVIGFSLRRHYRDRVSSRKLLLPSEKMGSIIRRLGLNSLKHIKVVLKPE